MWYMSVYFKLNRRHHTYTIGILWDSYSSKLFIVSIAVSIAIFVSMNNKYAIVIILVVCLVAAVFLILSTGVFRPVTGNHFRTGADAFFHFYNGA